MTGRKLNNEENRLSINILRQSGILNFADHYLARAKHYSTLSLIVDFESKPELDRSQLTCFPQYPVNNLTSTAYFFTGGGLAIMYLRKMKYNNNFCNTRDR